jgi:hypothetical protein
MTGSGGVIARWQHNAVVNGFPKNVTLYRIAIDAALRVTLRDEDRR